MRKGIASITLTMLVSCLLWNASGTKAGEPDSPTPRPSPDASTRQVDEAARCISAREWSRAIGLLEQVVHQAGPPNHRAWEMLGRAREGIGDGRGAFAAWTRVLDTRVDEVRASATAGLERVAGVEAIIDLASPTRPPERRGDVFLNWRPDCLEARDLHWGKCAWRIPYPRASSWEPIGEATDTHYVSDGKETLALDLSQHQVRWTAPAGGSRAQIHRQSLVITRWASESMTVVVLDPASGAVRWQSSCGGQGGWKKHGGVLYGVDRDELSALDLTSGRRLWKAPARTICGFYNSLVFSLEPGKSVLSARNATTGQVCWNLENAEYADVHEDGLYVGLYARAETGAYQFACLDPATGRERWRHPRGGNFYSRVFHSYHEIPVLTWKGLIVTRGLEATSCFLAAWNVSDGKKKWEAWVPAYGNVVTHRDNLAIVEGTGAPPTMKVSCLDLATGQVKWEHAIAGFFPSVKCMLEYVVVHARSGGGPFTFDTYVIARESGAVRWHFPQQDDFPLWAVPDRQDRNTRLYVLNQGRLWIWNLARLEAFAGGRQHVPRDGERPLDSR